MMEIEHEMTDYYIGVLHNFSLMKLSEYLEAMQERIDALEAENVQLRERLQTTTDAYESVLVDMGWTTSDDKPPSWHALIVTNRALLDKPAEEE